MCAEMLLDDLYQVIEKLRERITIHGVQLRQSEALTRSALVDPLLRALGWDTESPTLVMPEYKVTKVDGGSGTADYALLSEGNPAIVIEAKKLGTPLSDAANQCFQYCSKDGILYFAVTDGSMWDVYETNRPVAFAEKKIVSFDITDSPADVCLNALVLWRRSVQSGTVRKAQTPLLEPKAETPPVQPNSPLVPDGTNPPNGNWSSLAQLKPAKGSEPPSEIRFPDGRTANIQHWRDLPVEIANWLISQGKLDETQLPIQRNNDYYFLSTSPVHPKGKKFVAPKLVGKFYVDIIGLNAPSLVRNTVHIIERAGIEVTPEQFSVRLS